MIYKIAKFTVKKNKLKICKRAIKEFVHQIKNNEPGTILYESFQENNSSTFIHFMVFKDEKAEEKHADSEYVNKFTNILYPNCSKKPLFTELNLVESNRH
ncbi:MAG: antibiotic biosynthesis monooxygenase [Nanoarchaeota archaeon]